MSIRDRLQHLDKNSADDSDHALVLREDSTRKEKTTYQELKTRIHQKMLDRVDLSVMENLPAERLMAEIKVLVEQLLVEEKAPINLSERGRLVADIQHEVLGLGPLEPLLDDPTISDILVNTYSHVYVERQGKLELTDVHFADNGHLLKIIDRIVSRVGRRVDESSPMVDARSRCRRLRQPHAMKPNGASIIVGIVEFRGSGVPLSICTANVRTTAIIDGTIIPMKMEKAKFPNL